MGKKATLKPTNINPNVHHPSRSPIMRPENFGTQ